ncbi:uncharacterized protein [Halyomorpha halys]|uniref:uncharacterized protein n=1 Tax=Halyomorpha halys TaxID=286706 RepID=UPI0006D51715|nr:uncharacterized protein LOC106678914 [Halyomorpha halys]
MNMGSSIYNPDVSTKDLQRQQFIERARILLNRPKFSNEDFKMPLFQASLASTICERRPPFEDRYTMTGKTGSYDGSYSDHWWDSNTSVQSAREAVLTEKIKKVEDQLGFTAAQMRESQASKQFLKAKLKLLEQKVQQKMSIERVPIESLEVQQLNQLTSYAKETLERLKNLRGLQLQERCMKESYKKVEDMGMASYPFMNAPHSFTSNFSLTNH